MKVSKSYIEIFSSVFFFLSILLKTLLTSLTLITREKPFVERKPFSKNLFKILWRVKEVIEERVMFLGESSIF